MKNKLLLIVLIIIALTQPIMLSAKTLTQKPQPIIAESKISPVASEKIESKKLDPRAQILADYLTQHNSPLAYHAQDFIDAADQYGVDWKLVPAISGVESTFGKQIPGGYNAWGWGVYGDQALGFKSWKDGIYTVTQGLKENYINKGLTEPLAMNRVYASSQAWGGHVNFFLNDIDKFAKNYPIQGEVDLGSELKIAGSSAIIPPNGSRN